MRLISFCIILFFTHYVYAQDENPSMVEVNEIFSDLGKFVQHRDQAVNYHANIYIGAVNFEVLEFYRPATG